MNFRSSSVVAPRQIVKRNGHSLNPSQGTKFGQNQPVNQPPVRLNHYSYNQEPRDICLPPGFGYAQFPFPKPYQQPNPAAVPFYPAVYAGARDQVAIQPAEFNLPKNRSSSISSQGSDKRELPPPPKNNHMYHEKRYKTELCRQFEEYGTCEYGERCLFAHGRFELKESTDRHPKYKSELCSAFNRLGYCSFGTRCSFYHPPLDFDQLISDLMQPMLSADKWPDKHPDFVQRELMENMFNMCMPYVSNEARLPVFVAMCLKQKYYQ